MSERSEVAPEKLGIDVGQTSVGKYMVRLCQPPSQTWRTFLDTRADAEAALLDYVHRNWDAEVGTDQPDDQQQMIDEFSPSSSNTMRSPNKPTLPASSGYLLLAADLKIPVTTADAASALFTQYRDHYGIGASDMTDGCGNIHTADGTLVATVSYNGRVWTPVPKRHTNTNSQMENPVGRGFSSLLTKRGISDLRSS